MIEAANKPEVALVDIRGLRKIGEGSFATVHRGKLGNEMVVVKLLKPKYENDPLARNDLSRELLILSRLENDHIVKVLGWGTERKMPFIVLQNLKCNLTSLLPEPSDGTVTTLDSLGSAILHFSPILHTRIYTTVSDLLGLPAGPLSRNQALEHASGAEGLHAATASLWKRRLRGEGLRVQGCHVLNSELARR